LNLSEKPDCIQKRTKNISVTSVEGVTLTKFALRASEVIFDSEVHFMSEVLPSAKHGKLNFTASPCEQLHCAVAQLHFCYSKNFINKRADIPYMFALYVCHRREK